MSKTENNETSRIEIGRIKGLIFDIDGTLSDTDDHMVDRITRLLKPIAWLFRNKDPNHFARRLVMATETPANFIYGLVDSIGIDAPIAKIYNWISQTWPARKRKRADFMIVDGVREMLVHFYGRYPMAVVSARDALTTYRFLDAFDLRPYFETVITSQTCKHTKPYPDPVIFAAEKLGLSPEDCVMVGDTIVDIRAGKAAGTQTIAVLCGFGTARELKRVGADLILECTPEMKDLFPQEGPLS